jgi:3-phosphoinositide dependent protein kinase-1
LTLTSRSDIWAFGCIVFQLLTGKPPFRGATDYLTFQKILKREFDYPADFDEGAKSLIELVLNPDPTLRPTATEIKSHIFFASVDFQYLWTSPAPTITSGLTRPVEALASNDSNSDIWAVFDDEVSDGGFEYDDDNEVPPEDTANRPKYDQTAAADAVRHIDNHSPNGDLTIPQYPFQDAGSEGDGDGELQPPRPSFVDASPNRKWGRGRLGSKGSERTSSSSSTNRNALSGLLESLKLQGQGGSPVTPSGAASKGGSSRNSRTSDRSAELRVMQSALAESGNQARIGGQADMDKW